MQLVCCLHFKGFKKLIALLGLILKKSSIFYNVNGIQTRNLLRAFLHWRALFSLSIQFLLSSRQQRGAAKELQSVKAAPPAARGKTRKIKLK